MKNLFVLHTQYNLILSAGLSINQATGLSDLILFCDFELRKELKDKIYRVYRKVLILKGNFPKAELTVREKMKKIFNDNKEIRNFIKESYDEIFIVDDMCIQEMYALKCVAKFNNNIKMSWLEDGSNAYFDIGVISGGMGANFVKSGIRKFVFSFLYGLWGYYDLGTCMGTHKRLTNVYALFPEVVRQEHKFQNKKKITQDQFIAGMKFIYEDKPIHFLENSILIAIDKIDVYGNELEKINKFLAEIIVEARQHQKTVYYKYHPRENQVLEGLSGGIELKRSVAFESYLINSETEQLTIIGFKSTALQTAKKLGYETVSYIKQLETNNKNITKFYESIGVICK